MGFGEQTLLEQPLDAGEPFEEHGLDEADQEAEGDRAECPGDAAGDAHRHHEQMARRSRPVFRARDHSGVHLPAAGS